MSQSITSTFGLLPDTQPLTASKFPQLQQRLFHGLQFELGLAARDFGRFGSVQLRAQFSQDLLFCHIRPFVDSILGVVVVQMGSGLAKWEFWFRTGSACRQKSASSCSFLTSDHIAVSQIHRTDPAQKTAIYCAAQSPHTDFLAHNSAQHFQLISTRTCTKALAFTGHLSYQCA